MNIKTQWEILRIKQGVSWLSIAKKMNVNRKTLYSMVNSNNPTIDTIVRLSKAFNTSASSVIKEVENDY